jgi:homoprotocatechuate degradation regulator HpaR
MRENPMSHRDPIRRRNLPLLLLQARESVMGRFRPLLNEHGLTEQQWRVIRALLSRGAMEPREIVLTCGISSPSLVGVLARMDDLGLVARRRMDQDQRRVEVTLTAASLALAERMAPRIDALYGEIEALLGEDFLDQLEGVLDALVERLGRPDEAAG